MSRAVPSAETPERRHVGIAGVGVVSGYGWGRKLLHQGLVSGRSAIRPTRGFAPPFAHDLQWAAVLPDDAPEAEAEDLDARAVRFAVREAVEDAHDRGWRARGVVGIVHCMVPGGEFPKSGMVLSEIAQEFDFHGPVVGVSAMTASTIAGILTAKSWIESGVADDVVVIDSDIDASPERRAVLRDAGVLAPEGPAFEMTRPFQEGSRGMLPGEAAVALVLTDHRHGQYAGVLGGAMSYDAFRGAPAGTDATHIRHAVLEALANARVDPEQVAYVNAHGSGIPGCDALETAVYDEVMPSAGIFSVKPLVGHCQAASGGVELCASLYGFETGVIPAPLRVGKGHRRLLDGPTAATEGPVVKSSLGMSGHNAVLVLAAPAR